MRTRRTARDRRVPPPLAGVELRDDVLHVEAVVVDDDDLEVPDGLRQDAAQVHDSLRRLVQREPLALPDSCRRVGLERIVSLPWRGIDLIEFPWCLRECILGIATVIVVPMARTEGRHHLVGLVLRSGKPRRYEETRTLVMESATS